MAKLRHEINLLNTVLTGTGIVISDYKLDVLTYSAFASYIYGESYPSLYSGSSQFYLEVVASGNAGNTGSCSVVGSTGILLGSVSIGVNTSYQLFRSDLLDFKLLGIPSTGASILNLQLIGDGIRSQSIKAARLIILQTDSNINLLRHVGFFEIGNHEIGKVNTSAAALLYPKYWMYLSASWTSGELFSVQVCGAISDVMGTATYILQVSDASGFSGWTTVLTIGTINALSSTVIKSATFTPINGRNYRIAGSTSNNMYQWHIYGASISVYNNAFQTLLYSQNISSPSGNYNLWSGGFDNHIGQTFTTGGSVSWLRAVRFETYFSGDENLITGFAEVHLWALTGTNPNRMPTGNFLAEYLVPIVKGSNIQFAYFNYQLAANTSYGVSYGYWGGSSGNVIKHQAHTADSDAVNNLFVGRGGKTVWESRPTYESILRIYTSTTAQSTLPTKLETQYLLGNAQHASGTGNQNFSSVLNYNEWENAEGTIESVMDFPSSTSVGQFKTSGGTVIQGGIMSNFLYPNTGYFIYNNIRTSSGFSGYPNSYAGRAQSFDCSNFTSNVILKSVSAEIAYNFTLYTTPFTIAIYNHTGTFGSSGIPTGSPLYQQVFSTSIFTNTFTEYIFTFSSEWKLAPGVYCIAFLYQDFDWPLGVRLSTGDLYPGNSATYSSALGYWFTNSGIDMGMILSGVISSPFGNSNNQIDVSINPNNNDVAATRLIARITLSATVLIQRMFAFINGS